MALTITTNNALVFENVAGENGNADAADGGAQLLPDVDLMKRLVKETHDRTHEPGEPAYGFTQDEWRGLRKATERWKSQLGIV